MNIPIIEIIYCIFFVAFIAIMLILIKIIKQSNKEKKRFIEYLEAKGDYKNLKKFGFYNLNGFKEYRRIPFLDQIILYEYKLSKDKKLLEYYIYITTTSKRIISLFFLDFFIFCVIAIIVSI